MAWRGRKQLGQFMHLSLVCKDASFLPAAPDAAPTMSIYDSSGTETKADLKLPPQGFSETGQFGRDVFLDSSFSTGTYAVLSFLPVSAWTLAMRRRIID